MKSLKTTRDQYEDWLEWPLDNIKNEIGYFDISTLKPYLKGGPAHAFFRKRDFFKIILIKGKSAIQLADRNVKIKKPALCFFSPEVPYECEDLDEPTQGAYCEFRRGFFSEFDYFGKYEVFRPHERRFFYLNDEQYENVHGIFNQLATEYASDYKYKFDLIRNLILELIHFGLKLVPSTLEDSQLMNASQRISISFLNLLEQQFQIDKANDVIGLRSPSEFARTLNIHVNHLNRSVKEALGKPTSRLIQDRIIKESKVLLKQTTWNVADIAYTLGFTETTHFNNFFKKHVELSPLKFRSN